VHRSLVLVEEGEARSRIHWAACRVAQADTGGRGCAVGTAAEGTHTTAGDKGLGIVQVAVGSRS